MNLNSAFAKIVHLMAPVMHPKDAENKEAKGQFVYIVYKYTRTDTSMLLYWKHLQGFA